MARSASAASSRTPSSASVEASRASSAGIVDLLDRGLAHPRVGVFGEGAQELALFRGEPKHGRRAHGGVGALPFGLREETVEDRFQGGLLGTASGSREP